MRVAAHIRRVEADAAQHVVDIGGEPGICNDAVHDRRLADDVGDAHARVERGVRVLEDHLHRQLRRLALGRFERRPIAAAIEDAALARRHDAGDDAAERRLAAAGFADETDDLAATNDEIDRGDGIDDLLAHRRAEPARQLLGEIERFGEALADAAQLDERG